MTKNPMLDALAKKARPKFDKAPDVGDLAPPQRIFQLNHKEVPSLKALHPGDPLTYQVQGKIHSIDQHGNAVIHIQSVSDTKTK